ncbi:uncharacterized protein STEHIDRAFT_59114 [Stereum hirsutum FP-91666 SS1]|uniref:uncharacterized protein n=1 Tax=Stereum hirsutum (strain FP-91666) TaxID=721885 RepID=UPI0004449E2B|nr:uncharacterized protein STEHIDRAFT_59114 [Stereum hirsutum FP-91666 SS1]EIM85743.1 hypothetical protein STEHIDRAFT_59114 [Stereum hirsutum FP-91666 SS1]
MKRLAKLQGPSPSSSSPSPSTSSTPVPTPVPVQKPKPIPAPTPKRSQDAVPVPLPPQKKVSVAPPKFNYSTWEPGVISSVFRVTLDRDVALKSDNDLVWLKSYAEDSMTDEGPPRLAADAVEGVVIARLDLDPSAMQVDDDYSPFLARIPSNQTVFEYLTGCWKRLNTSKSALLRRGYPPADLKQALALEESMRHLIISYIGIDLMSPEAFPHPPGKAIGAPEFTSMLLSLSSFAASPYASSGPAGSSLSPSEIESLLSDIVWRFDPDGELESVLGPVVIGLLHHECLFSPEGIASADSLWRGVVGGLEVLVANKSVVKMMCMMEEWCANDADAPNFERASLLGPLLRLNVFPTEWPHIAKTYFTDVEGRPAQDVESARNSLRGTLKSLQSSLFQIFNTIVRTSPECREAFLAFVARVIELNIKRAGMQVEAETVSSDSFMTNLQLILFSFVDPFMDASYSKIDRIDRLYYAHTSRLNIKEETRINATSDEASQWAEANQLAPGAPPPNFISDVYFLTLAMFHYGFLKTVDTFEEYAKDLDDTKKRLEQAEGDTTWQGTMMAPRMEAYLKQLKEEISKITAAQTAASTQLLDPEVLFKANAFVSFVTTWIIRFVDPKRAHPKPMVQLPLPADVPVDWKVLPEYVVEDAINYLVFVVRHHPQSLELQGRDELLNFTLSFLTSTWYIKNPFLKAKLVEILFFGAWPYRGNQSLLGSNLNASKVALDHLMRALMHFYIEVEQTGASSQFYDKFSTRYISYILKSVWENQEHRAALRNEAKNNIEKFIRFVNLMINDVTYLMDESLSELHQIYTIQHEMDQPEWSTRPLQQRRERLSTLGGLERHASSYVSLGKSTVDMLKLFTAETKEPFMMPEIVDKLAAMLDYNLEALVGPKCKELRVKNMEKYSFNPRKLLSDVLQVYLNLSDCGEFVKAVAGDGRSYKKELFESAAGTAMRYALKTEGEIEKLRLFVVMVEEAKATMDAEEELGDVPDEFLDPLMYTVMKDPVILPSSRTVIDRSTIKSHLLSDSKDPFNRQPLKIEDVVPDDALRTRIQEFLIARRNPALGQSAENTVHLHDGTDQADEMTGISANQGEAMDTS